MRAEIIPPFILIDYVWAILKKNTDMKESDYEGLIPIVPLSEVPEINEYAKPYIVYGYSESPPPDLWVRRRGNMAFVVYSTDYREVSKITNVIVNALNRADETARDVNAFSTTIPAYIGLRFGFIQVSYVEGGSPEETEGGRISSAINVRFEYYVDYSINTSAL